MAKLRKMLSDTNAKVIQNLMALIETQSKTTLINWTTDYAEAHLLPIYTSHFPEDDRPEQALAAARRWRDQEIKLPQAKPLILACHAAAREAEGDPVAQAAARAIGQAASTVHSATHSLGLALYGGLALAYARLGTEAAWEVIERAAFEECESMLSALQAIAVREETNPVKVKWYC